MILKEITKSPTDSNVGLSVKHDKFGHFAYDDYRIVEGLHDFILDCYVTPTTTPGHQVVLQ